MAIYNIIGTDYNRTRKADPFITEQLHNLLSPKKGLAYLDIGCGTGNYTSALFNRGVAIRGLDPSEKMLSIAQSRNNKVTWTIGTAESLPFDNNHFSGAIATLTIHHWQNFCESFKEIHRVLKPGSDLVIFTATPEQMQNYWLGHYFPLMMKASIQQMPSLTTIKYATSLAGFELLVEIPYLIKDDLQDLFLYAGKNNPSLYLDEEARKNISSFASLAVKDEVAAGLDMLSADMANGRFGAVKAAFNALDGDYLFLKLAKG